MKNIIFYSLLVFYSVLQISAKEIENEEKAKELYREALKLEKTGDILGAIQNMHKVTQFLPKSESARLDLLRMNAGKTEAMKQRKLDRLNKVIIEEVYFDNDTLDEALLKVSQQIELFNQKNKTTYQSNLIKMDRKKVFENYRIKFHVKKVPLKVVLENMMPFVKGTYLVEDYAVKVYPRG